jgi:hypothetical protein
MERGMSWSKADAAISFAAWFAGLSDDDISDMNQWSAEKLSRLRGEAVQILEMHD